MDHLVIGSWIQYILLRSLQLFPGWLFASLIREPLCKYRDLLYDVSITNKIRFKASFHRMVQRNEENDLPILVIFGLYGKRVREAGFHGFTTPSPFHNPSVRLLQSCYMDHPSEHNILSAASIAFLDPRYPLCMSWTNVQCDKSEKGD